MSEKRPYTMSDKALEQRKAAAAKSTGPVTEEGKAASSRNAWRHGLYSAASDMQTWSVAGAFGKPCRRTCAKYPCSLVEDETTKPGRDCLDKEVYVRAFDAILETMASGDAKHSHSMLAGQVAGAVEVLQQMRNEIAEHGLTIRIPLVDKNGAAIMLKVRDDETGEFIDVPATKTVPNPIIPHYNKMLDVLGINLPEMLATPRSVSKLIDPEDPDDPVMDLMRGVATAFGAKRRPLTIDNDGGS